MNKKLSKILVITLICLLLVCVSLIVFGCENIGLSKQPMATIYFYMQGDRVSYQFVSLNQVLKAPDVSIPDGYQLDGWFFDENTWTNEFTKTSLTALIDSGETQANVYAKVSPIEYGINYANVKDADVSALPTQYTVESETITLPDISVEYYLFDGWYDGQQKVEQIAKGSFGNKTLTAKFTPIDYVITYNDTRNATNGNPAKYNIESGKIDLVALSKDGYKFEGWYNKNELVTSIPANSHGNVELTAKWSLVTYTIAYEQAMTADTSEFPNTFTIESDSISIPDISVEYYTFEGWYDGQQKVEQIATGSFGNKVLKAKLTPINYTITYNGTRNAVNGNPAKYNIESGEITLAAITANGYSFDGWYKDGTLVTSIPANSHGSIELTAKWSLVTYTISYDQTLTADTSESPKTFTIESDSISIPDISVEYYDFEGWYLNGEKVEAIVAGSFGNKVLSAKLTPVDYTITYNGTRNAANGNPAKYNIESGEITLAPITANGYSFDGWYKDGTLVTSIPASSHGNVELTAKWSLVTYTISYDQTFTVDTSEFPGSYTIESENIDLPTEMTVICRIFTGWTLDGNVVTEIPTGTYGNLVLTATYQLDHMETVDAYVAPTCEATGLSEGSHCDRCSEVIVAQNTIPALGHDYVASWGWEGFTSAKLGLVCRNDNSHVVTLDAELSHTTVQATCTEEGMDYYIAKVTYNGIDYSNTKTQVIEKIPHNYVAIANDKEKHSCSMCNQLFDHVDTSYTGTCEQCEMKYADIIQIATSYNLVDVKLELDKIYVLTADITLDGTWAALGSSSQPFTGKFYGNGHIIKNLTIENTTGYGGLFAVNNGLIDGLTLENVTINSKAGSPATVICGGICAVNNGRITNCIIKGNSAYNSDNTQYNNDRDINYYGGLICGSNGKTGVIDSCQINGTVSNYIHVKADARGQNMGSEVTCTVRSYVYYGNIAGENNGQINECVSNAEHTARGLLEATGWRKADTGRAKITTYLGSLVGKNSGDVISCSAKASVITEKKENSQSVNYQLLYDIKQEPQYEGIVGVNSNGKIVGFEKL